ncbi:MAG: carbohydrate kinase family protein [Marinilabiliaceae bacterium]
MRNMIVIGIGEILWDLLPGGKQLGGAPANFAWHAQQLGARGFVISAVGGDQYGREILDLIRQRKLGNGISVSEKPTGVVEVKLENGIPDYIIHEDVAWDNIELNQEAVDALVRADALCFGSLAQRSRFSHETISRAIDMTPECCLKIFDINLRQHFYNKDLIQKSLQKADVFKLNNEELLEIKDFFQLRGNDEAVCRKILKAYELKMVVLTGGDQGSMLLTSSEISELKTPKTDVADTIGAGDAFTAAVTMGILHDLPLKEIHEKAVKVSAFVCTRSGAMPVLPPGII